MKLLIIFDKNIEISPEKICVHTGHSNREIHREAYELTHKDWNKWSNNHFKSVLLRDIINEGLITKIKRYPVWYKIYDAGLDGMFEKGTVIGYAVLVPNDDDTFKRLRTLKFEKEIDERNL